MRRLFNSNRKVSNKVYTADEIVDKFNKLPYKDRKYLVKVLE